MASENDQVLSHLRKEISNQVVELRESVVVYSYYRGQVVNVVEHRRERPTTNPPPRIRPVSSTDRRG